MRMSLPAETLARVESVSLAAAESGRSILRYVWDKNWWLIFLYLIIAFVIALPLSYFLNDWWSVLATFILNVASTVVGLFAVVRTAVVAIEYLTKKPVARGWLRNWLPF